MTKADLLTSFRSCKRYKQAPRWQKPWLNPGRFIRNQLNKYHIQTYKLAELRKIDAFHMPRFTIVNGEGVGEQIASYGIYEESLTEAFLRLVKPGQTVVDVGMHLGYYTTLFAVLVGELGQIHAFEPTPSTRAVARYNVERFHYITVHAHAVWSSTCRIDFCDYGPQWMAFNSFTNPRVSVEPRVPTKIQVETTTLDQFRDAFGGTIDLYYARLHANWKVIEKVTLGTSFDYEHGSQVDIGNETFDRYGAGVTLGRPITAKLSGELGYRFYVRNSDLADRDYTVNVVSLNLNYSF